MARSMCLCNRSGVCIFCREAIQEARLNRQPSQKAARRAVSARASLVTAFGLSPADLSAVWNRDAVAVVLGVRRASL